MKQTLIIIFILIVSNCYSQQLTINETINYINDKLSTRGTIEINSEGQFIYKKNGYDSQTIRKKSNGDLVADTKITTYKTYVERLKVERLPSTQYFGFRTKLECNDKNYCIWKDGGWNKENEIWFDFGINKKNRDKTYNAFKYLFGLIKESNAYQNVDDDPFANENFNSTYSYITGLRSKEKIELEKESGVYYITIQISGVNKRFVLDSGASELSLSSELEKELIARGILTKESYIEPALYRIANGSIVAKRRVLLKEVKVGEYTVNNVTASIGSSNIPLLLGKSFLDKFSKWTIDNETEKLILEK